MQIAEAPRVMRMFLSHGDACTKVEASALDLVSNGPTTEHEEDEPLNAYSNMLDNLGEIRPKLTLAAVADVPFRTAPRESIDARIDDKPSGR